MRVVVALLAAITLPSLAAAQSTSSDRRPFTGLAPIGLPLPSITSTLPPIGLGLPPIGLAPYKDTTVRIRDRRPDRPEPRPRPDGRRRSRSYPTVVYVVAPPYYMEVPAPIGPATTFNIEPPPPPAPPAAPAGVVQLDLDAAPRGAHVYVDRYFVGTLEDVNGHLRLETGPHQIEVQAADHEPLVFDVRVVADRSIRYQGALKRIAGNTAAAEAPTVPTTIYFIPGCYLGNVPPTPTALPATCDIGKLTTHKP